jgi:guanyl-specific ribonuclease Sa
VFANDDSLNSEDSNGLHCFSFVCLYNDLTVNVEAASAAVAIVSVTVASAAVDDAGGGLDADAAIVKLFNEQTGDASASTEIDASTQQRIETTYKNVEDGNLTYSKDGTVWNNKDGNLPLEKPGFYKEYTVDNSGTSGRGVERLVIGENGDVYYTADHYATFVKITGLGK